MVKDIQEYFENGCGRCAYFATDRCKVRLWKPVLIALRDLVKSCGLKEEMKWGNPCYTSEGKNVLMISALKEHCAISFFNGFLLEDREGILESPGPNSRFAKYIKVHSVDQVKRNTELYCSYVNAAKGLDFSKVEKEKISDDLPIPPELKHKFKEDEKLEKAFFSLTKGRQRGYLLYFNQAKQSETRIKRIEKYYDKIFSGKGLHDQ